MKGGSTWTSTSPALRPALEAGVPNPSTCFAVVALFGFFGNYNNIDESGDNNDDVGCLVNL